jgi:hypothetical protein
MPFVLTKDRIRSAVDLETNARLVIDGTPEIEYLKAKFESPEIRFSVTLMIESKFPDRPFVANDQTNPAIMIFARDLNLFFQAKKMLDFDYNTKLVEYVVRMIAFINRHYPISRSPYLWSDYDDLASGRKPLNGRFLYRMPSDDELLKMSLKEN